MSFKLSDDDRRAVDMILDQGISPTVSNVATVGTSAVDVMRTRLNKAGELLAMLSHMPSTEPPTDLVAKTLRFIERSGRGDTDAQVMPPTLDMLGLDQSMA